MPRVGISMEEQVSSSQFKFEDGNGEIVSASVVVDQIEGWDPKCGIKIGVQRMTKDWKPTDDEVVEEVLGCGPVTKFHPGNAASSDDQDPEDLGDEVGVEGNCIYSVEGGRVDKKSKSAIFSASLQELGFKPALLNGYMPNLVGLKATFTQKMLPKGEGFTGKRDPTCLIVGMAGQVAGGKIVQFPYQKTGAAGVGATVTTGSGAKTAAASTQAAGGKANGAAKPAIAGTTAKASAVSEDVDSTATNMLAAVHSSSAGQTMSRQKIGSKLVTLLAKNRVDPKLHKPVQELIKNDEWFTEKAGDLGWAMLETGEVQIPAVESAG